MNRGCQTDRVVAKDSFTTGIAKADVAIQAEVGQAYVETDAQIEGWSTSQDVAQAILAAGRTMLRELEHDAAGTDYLSYILPEATQSDNDTATGMIASFLVVWPQTDDSVPRSAAEAVQIPCTGVSWNSTGSSLAASYGKVSHEGWCTHACGVAVWTIGPSVSRGNNVDQKRREPDIKLECPSCAWCVAWHPDKPSVLAAGTYNGEIFLWDTNRIDDPLLCKSRIDDYFHREPVTSVAWVHNHLIPGNAWHLISTSTDGKVLSWSITNDFQYPFQSYQLKGRPLQRVAAVEGDGDYGGHDDPQLRTAAGRSTGATRAMQSVILGVTTVAFPLCGEISSEFVAGTEGGGLFKCLNVLVASDAIPTSYRDKTFLDTTGFAQPGSIPGADTSLCWARAAASSLMRIPVTDRAKVSRDIEKFVRESGMNAVTMAMIYDSRADSRLLFPNPIDFAFVPHAAGITCIALSPFRRNVFASTSVDGKLRLYSILDASPLLNIDVDVSGLPVNWVSWSFSRPLVLAVAQADGIVSIYDLFHSTSTSVMTLSATSASGDGQSKPPLPATAQMGTATSVLCTSFNARRKLLLAFGNSAGNVVVWKLPASYQHPYASEQKLLNILVESGSAQARH